MRPLEGRRILLVEDEFVIALMAEEMLSNLGATVVGPAGTIARALALAETEEFDAAVLDINMNGERVGSVVEALARRAIPIVFATGYGSEASGMPQDAPILDKPYTQKGLAHALARVLHIGAAASDPEDATRPSR